MRNLLAVSVLATIATLGTACSGARSLEPFDPPTAAGALAGTWQLTGATAGFFTALRFSVGPGQFGTLGGEATATARDCGAGLPCELHGIAFDGVDNAGAAAVTLTFRELPVGATITGTITGDTFRAVIVTRANARGIGPDAITLTR